MARCDLCGEACPAYNLEQLREAYQVPGVVDVCPSCKKWASSVKDELMAEIAPRMREAVAQRKGAVTPIIARRWYWPFAALKEQQK